MNAVSDDEDVSREGSPSRAERMVLSFRCEVTGELQQLVETERNLTLQLKTTYAAQREALSLEKIEVLRRNLNRTIQEARNQRALYEQQQRAQARNLFGRSKIPPRKIVLPPGTSVGRVLRIFMRKDAYERWVYPA